MVRLSIVHADEHDFLRHCIEGVASPSASVAWAGGGLVVKKGKST